MRHSTYCLIMAGGSGTRFCSRSRDKRYRQFPTIFGNETLTQSTINRFLPIIPMDNIYLISKQLQKEEILRQNLTINSDNIYVVKGNFRWNDLVWWEAACYAIKKQKAA
jgi:mannose-1-phosphate guanylyltransferase